MADQQQYDKFYTMEGTNNQDDTIGMNNDVGNVDEISNIDEEDSDYYDDDQCYKLNKNIFQQLKNNAPTITVVRIDLQDDGCFFNSIDWKEDGDCISNNTHLKMLRINYWGRCLGRPYGEHYILGEQGNELPTREQLREFFSCIHRNCFINQIIIHHMILILDEFTEGLIEGLQGHPSLTRLEIGNGGLGSISFPVGCSAVGKVLKHPESKLKDLRLPDCQLDDEGLGTLCDALMGNSTLKKLDLSGNKKITSIGWRALSTVLQHPNCKLVGLNLHHTEIYEESSNMLEIGSSTSSLKNLGFTYKKSISNDAWQTFLKSSQSLHLDLKIHDIDDDSRLDVLVDNIGTLKSLELSGNEAIVPERWQRFFKSLQTRGIQLKEFDIYHAKVGDVGATALGSWLNSMTMLKTLSIDFISSSWNDSDSISSQGWVSLFNSLQDNNNLDLSSLSLHSNKIDDEGLQLLVSLASRMKSLKILCLHENDLVTPLGWQVFSGLLQNPNFTLNELYISSNNINDDTLVEFTNALAYNKTLKYLDVGSCSDDDGNARITERGWEAVSTLLCNKTSIMDTYNSNHILQDPGDYAYPLDTIPTHLVESLDLNENKDKVEVARQKILRTHFSDDNDDTANMQEFLDMELEVMPTAIAWIGRPSVGWVGRDMSRLSLMFNLMRRMPDMVDSSDQKRSSTAKRKRVL